MNHSKIAVNNASGGRAVLEHDRREVIDRQRKNEKIDPSRTHLNRDYSLRKMTSAQAWKWTVEYAQAHSKRKIRDNTVVMAQDIIHLPKNWYQLYPDKPASEFFEQVAIPFLRERYGEENEVSCIVHYDEGGAPHVHRKSVPLTKDGRLSHKAVYNRTELSQVHPALVKFAEEAGYPGLDLYDEERAKARTKALDMPEYKLATAELDKLLDTTAALARQADAQAVVIEAQAAVIEEQQARALELEQEIQSLKAERSFLLKALADLQERFSHFTERLNRVIEEVFTAPFKLFKEWVRVFGAAEANNRAAAEVKGLKSEAAEVVAAYREWETALAAYREAGPAYQAAQDARTAHEAEFVAEIDAALHSNHTAQQLQRAEEAEPSRWQWKDHKAWEKRLESAQKAAEAAAAEVERLGGKERLQALLSESERLRAAEEQARRVWDTEAYMDLTQARDELARVAVEGGIELRVIAAEAAGMPADEVTEAEMDELAASIDFEREWQAENQPKAKSALARAVEGAEAIEADRAEMKATMKPQGQQVERKGEPSLNQLGRQAQASIDAQVRDGIGGRSSRGRGGYER